MIAHDDDQERLGDPLDFPAPIPELASLHPARSDDEWNALVAGIVRGAAPELARRRAERGLVHSILRWSRPVGIAAAAVLLFGAAGLALTSDAEAASAAPTFAEVVDREPASALMATERPPSVSDLESVLEADSFLQVQP